MMRLRTLATLLLLGTLLLLAACGTGPEAPAAQQEAAPAAGEAADEAAAEAPAEQAAGAAVSSPYGAFPADAVAYPAAEEIDLGAEPVAPMAIDQIVTYKALDEYHEPE